MANYMLVDVDKLEADLTKVADSIRSKGGTSAKLAFPDGFKSAVDAIVINIDTDPTVQRKTGSFTTSNSGTASVDCGFRPDLVAFYTGDSHDDENPMWAAFAFEISGQTTLEIGHAPSSKDYDDAILSLSVCTRTNTGFSIRVKDLTGDIEEVNAGRVTYSYTALKYT